jgi:hypothetical protein
MLSSSRNCCSVWHLPRPLVLVLAGMTLVVMLAGCKREVAQEAPPARPVRTVIAEKGGLGKTIVLTGQIQAEKEVALAFRIGAALLSDWRIPAIASLPIRCWPSSIRRMN